MLAALAGIVLLGQLLDVHESVGIALVVLASAFAVVTARAPVTTVPVELDDARAAVHDEPVAA